MTEGHEALAIFTTSDTAAAYSATLSDAPGWKIYQPPREKVIDILTKCRAAGILYAALDPIGGAAKTLFDIPQVLRGAGGQDTAPTR